MPKRATPKKSRKSRKSKTQFTLSSTNLKFIGAAFDQAIADLQIIKGNAANKKDVLEKIAKLQALRLETSRVCPQSWYMPFDVGGSDV